MSRFDDAVGRLVGEAERADGAGGAAGAGGLGGAVPNGTARVHARAQRYRRRQAAVRGVGAVAVIALVGFVASVALRDGGAVVELGPNAGAGGSSPGSRVVPVPEVVPVPPPDSYERYVLEVSLAASPVSEAEARRLTESRLSFLAPGSYELDVDAERIRVTTFGVSFDVLAVALFSVGDVSAEIGYTVVDPAQCEEPRGEPDPGLRSLQSLPTEEGVRIGCVRDSDVVGAMRSEKEPRRTVSVRSRGSGFEVVVDLEDCGMECDVSLVRVMEGYFPVTFDGDRAQVVFPASAPDVGGVPSTVPLPPPLSKDKAEAVAAMLREPMPLAWRNVTAATTGSIADP